MMRQRLKPMGYQFLAAGWRGGSVRGVSTMRAEQLSMIAVDVVEYGLTVPGSTR